MNSNVITCFVLTVTYYQAYLIGHICKYCILIGKCIKVCLLGVGGLGSEVAKNLVLAGINTMEMVDCENVSDQGNFSDWL